MQRDLVVHRGFDSHAHHLCTGSMLQPRQLLISHGGAILNNVSRRVGGETDPRNVAMMFCIVYE